MTSCARFLRGDRIVDGIDYGVIGGLGSAGIPEQRVFEALRTLTEQFNDEIARRDQKRRWCMKTAIDSFYVPEIEKLFAGHAKFICLLRHGLDASLSLDDLCRANEVYVRELHEYIRMHPRPLEAFARAWVDVTTDLLELAERHPDSTAVIRYEDLVQNPGETMSRIMQFLGEEWPPGLERQLREDLPQGIGDWKTYSTRMVGVGSIDRWRQLSQGSLALLAPIVNPLLVRCGYAAVTSPPPLSSTEAMRRYELAMSLQAMRAQTGDE